MFINAVFHHNNYITILSNFILVAERNDSIDDEGKIKPVILWHYVPMLLGVVSLRMIMSFFYGGKEIPPT